MDRLIGFEFSTPSYTAWNPSMVDVTKVGQECIHWIWPVPFHLLEGANVEARIVVVANNNYGGTGHPDPKVRFRLGGTKISIFAGTIYQSEAIDGAVFAEFDPVVNGTRYESITTIARPSGVEYVRLGYIMDQTRKLGVYSGHVHFRGLP